MYIHQHSDWPNFTWDSNVILPHVSKVRNLQGRLIGKMESLGFDLQDEAVLTTLSEDVLKSSEIEGERLNPEEVRSSVAKRLGMELAGLPDSSRDVDGVVDMVLDATQNYNERLTKDRLFAWHSSLFPTGRSGLHKITVGKWRSDALGKMKVISGVMGKEKVHYIAPDASRLHAEMTRFFLWFNQDDDIEPLIKSALAHLYFVSIHPFDDGNGRIARAIADAQLARADETKQRFYSISSEILKAKKEYYTILELTQKGDLNVTSWLIWYFERLNDALVNTETTLSQTLLKARFWERHKDTPLNERQKKVLNLLLGNFLGKLQASKWAALTKVHRDTARRDIQDLIQKGILKESKQGGRSTTYRLVLHI